MPRPHFEHDEATKEGALMTFERVERSVIPAPQLGRGRTGFAQALRETLTNGGALFVAAGEKARVHPNAHRVAKALGVKARSRQGNGGVYVWLEPTA